MPSGGRLDGAMSAGNWWRCADCDRNTLAVNVAGDVERAGWGFGGGGGDRADRRGDGVVAAHQDGCGCVGGTVAGEGDAGAGGGRDVRRRWWPTVQGLAGIAPLFRRQAVL